MKKLVCFLLFFSILFTRLNVQAKTEVESGSLDFATISTNKTAIQKLDDYLREVDVPETVLDKMSYEQKSDFHSKKLHFIDGTTTDYFLDKNNKLVEKINMPLLNSETIPATDLQVSHIFGGGTSSKTGDYLTVYATYEWKIHRSTKGHKICISIPDGWKILPDSYECFEASWITKSNYSKVGNGGGSPFDINFYGAVWSLTAGTLHPDPGPFRYRGFVTFNIKQTTPNARREVISKYVIPLNDSGSLTIGIGPLSIQLGGNGTLMQKAWHSEF